ncbi:unnamed protein product [Aureobasidium pullulans]|nr:unnamed protein product [Aureobasidium pullulans]
MEFDLIVKMVTASEVLPLGLEIGVKDGKISCIGTSLPASSSTKVIDAEGAYITPGGIDSHVHLAQANSPTGDDWETGSRSAIAGGTTTIIAFASQERHEESLMPVLADYHSKSRELPVLAQQEGITSVKLYMTYEPMKLNDRELLEIMMACRKLGMTTMIHAENSDMIALIIEGLEANGNTEPFFHSIARPRIAEDEASYRAISLAELYDHPGGKKLGVVNGIPRFAKIPNGLPGVETRMSLLFSQTKMYGLGGVKGSIAPGYDADLVIWHAESKGECVISQDMLHHGVDYTPFEGVKVRNWPRYTILRGKVVWNKDDGRVVGEMEYGQYLKRGKGEVVVGKTGGRVHGMLEDERKFWMQ